MIDARRLRIPCVPCLPPMQPPSVQSDARRPFVPRPEKAPIPSRSRPTPHRSLAAKSAAAEAARSFPVQAGEYPGTYAPYPDCYRPLHPEPKSKSDRRAESAFRSIGECIAQQRTPLFPPIRKPPAKHPSPEIPNAALTAPGSPHNDAAWRFRFRRAPRFRSAKPSAFPPTTTLPHPRSHSTWLVWRASVLFPRRTPPTHLPYFRGLRQTQMCSSFFDRSIYHL